MSSSRTKKSIRNIVYGFFNQLVMLILGFISRMIFLKYLNESYLGINSLFTEILSMLSLADLGLTTVMVYTFYKPLANNDKKKLSALLNFYKTLYKTIAIVVTVIGFILIPFLRYIVNTNEKIDHLYLYYILFLLKTVISYLFVYKVSILNADQNNYLVSKISTNTRVLTVLLQIIVLCFTKNYTLYLVVDIFTTWLNNYWCAKIVDKRYPYLKGNFEISKNEKRDIFKNVGSGFLYKLSSVLLNSTDNTLISIILSTEVVGLYSNYGLLFSRLSMFINILFSSLSGSIGNLIATEDRQHRYRVFNIIQSIGFLISSITSVCCFLLINDFISIWLGSKFVFGVDVQIACVFNYYFSISLQPLWIYRDATGLYKQTKYVMICTAIVNLVLSIILGYQYGLFGIIVASIISRICTYFWYEPILLYKQFFEKKVTSYFIKHLYNFAVTLITMLFGLVMFKHVYVTNIFFFFGKVVFVLIYSVAAIYLFYFWRKDYKNLINYFKSKLIKK
ncbi:MAG: hypothetical protein KHZ85_06695 [Amedibacillus dolichus]|uniref:Transporter n=1 Tax=Amedibacillus dolichus TaxID=31971 RepID=A0A942WHQ7_9FIRM|nr:hypothetical protein [Amedibacillus dolichus]MBS4884437.1 hypothetical protein [Amedibacillus dolichus]